MSVNEMILDKRAREIEWSKDKGDGYDYSIAVFCGFAAEIIDSLFVDVLGQSRLGMFTDKDADELVKKIANMCWNGDGCSSQEGEPKNVPNIIGLLFSILDQFTGTASFINNGELIHLYPVKDAGYNKITYMQGTNFESRIFCGICNWLGYLASDLCGSTRKIGKTETMPFYDLFLWMDFSDFDGYSFAEMAVKVFEDGYDLSQGAAMEIPVLITELSIKLIWALKRHFYLKKEWRECIPTQKHADLRIMLMVGDATLCLMDEGDAAMRMAISDGNPITFMLHMNFVAWSRLVILVFKELRIRYGGVVDQAVSQYLSEIGLKDKYALKQYYDRMNALDCQLEQLLMDFISGVEKEYKGFVEGANRSLNPKYGTSSERRIASVKFAKEQGVSSERIFESNDDLKAWIEKGWKR